MLLPGKISEDCTRIRQQSPLVHNITNYVAMSLSANALLAVGASPLMSSEPEEMVQTAAVADALAVNIGCLERRQAEAMRIAAEAYANAGKPWVLDPAGVGISALRRSTCEDLISLFHPTVIRGNASEIMLLAGLQAVFKGVDSAEESGAALESAVKLARDTGAVVSVSGPVDYITDGKSIISIFNGNPVMPRVTAMGCTATALTAAFAAVGHVSPASTGQDGPAMPGRGFLSAAAGAMALMGVAGEMAAAQSAGPGSFTAAFLDALAATDPETISKSLRYEEFAA